MKIVVVGFQISVRVFELFILILCPLKTLSVDVTKDLLPMCGLIAQLVEHRTGIRGGHGFESHWGPDFFQASSFQLLKLENLLRWLLFTFIFNRSTNMNYHVHTSCILLSSEATSAVLAISLLSSFADIFFLQFIQTPVICSMPLLSSSIMYNE